MVHFWPYVCRIAKFNELMPETFLEIHNMNISTNSQAHISISNHELPVIRLQLCKKQYTGFIIDNSKPFGSINHPNIHINSSIKMLFIPCRICIKPNSYVCDIIITLHYKKAEFEISIFIFQGF